LANITGGQRVSFTLSTSNTHSNRLSFIFFDLSTITISSISPSQGLNSSNHVTQITGAGFLNVDSVQWIIGSNHHGNCSYSTSTTYTCVLSPFPFPSQQLVQITIDGSETGFVQLKQNQTAFTFFSSSPVAYSTRFSPAHSSLIVSFDREVEIGGEAEYNTTTRPNCSNIFDTTTLQLLGNSATCKWKNTRQREVVIDIFNDSLITTGNRVGVSGGGFRTRGVLFSRLNTVTVLEVEPSDGHTLFNPIAIITGPTVVPACSDEVAFSGIYSQNSGPHSLRYLWNVSVMSFNASNATNYDSMVAMETILQYFPQSFTSNPLLTLPSSAFDEEYYYTIFLTARNFLGFHSNSSVIVTKQPMEVMLLGNNFVRVNPLDDVIVEVTVQTTSCHVMSDSLQFSWAMEDTSNRDNVSDVTHLLDTTTLLSPLLWIPRHTLLPGHQYRLIASLTSTQSSGVLAGYHSIQMDVSHPNIVIRFVGGAYVTLPHGSDVLLDISPSLNLDQYSKDEVGVSWGCVTGNPPSPCMNVVSDEILSLPSALTFTIPPTHLTPGTYRMTATIAGPSSASGSLLVNILQPSAPGGGVRIVTVERGRPCIVPADEAVIEALVQTPQVGVIEWEGLFVPGHAHLVLTPSNTRSPTSLPVLSADDYISEVNSEDQRNLLVTPTQWQRVSLVLEDNVLLSGETYTFGLRYAVAMETVAMAQVDVHVCQVPTLGTLHVALSSEDCGVGLHLSAAQWTDAPYNLPLKYHFGISYNTDKLVKSSINWLGAPLTSSVLHTVILPPTAVSMVTVVLRVYNSKNSYSDTIKYVPRPPTTPCSLETRLVKIWSLFANSNHYQQLLVDLIASLPVATGSGNSSLKEVYNRVVSIVTDVHAHLLPRSTPFILSLLRIVRALSSWQVGRSDDIIAVVLDRLQCGGTSPTSCPLLENGLCPSEGIPLLELVENLLYTSTPVDWRIQATQDSEELLRTLNYMGRALCVRQGLGEESVTITTAHSKLTLKATLTFFPKQYLVSDVATTTDKSVIVHWSNEVEQHLGARGGWRDCYHHGNIRGPCDGVCLISVTYSDDLHWVGGEYTPLIKSTPISLTLISQSNGSVVTLRNLIGGVSTVFPLVYGQGSPRGNLECVVWDAERKQWSSTSCAQEIQSENVTCTCSEHGDFTVLETCSSGYYGNMCLTVCPQGLWGIECKEVCMCSGRGTCHASSGVCNCTSGYIGGLCQQKCPIGHYGYQCLQECRCENGGVCSHIDGSCGCGPGWVGTRCELACSSGYYGDGCQGQCRCREVSQCDRITGQCVCDAGYRGPNCDIGCPDGKFGIGCSMTCSCEEEGTKSCDRFNGTCYCIAGWKGLNCDETPPQPISQSPPVWAAGIAVVVVLLAAVVLLCVIIALNIRRRRRRWQLKVEPSSQDCHVESDSIVLVKTSPHLPGVGEDSEDDLNITKTTSLSVIVPQGSQLKDMFSKSGEKPSFKEPEEIDGNPRWTVVHVYRKETSPRPSSRSGQDTPLNESGVGLEHKVYPNGVYMQRSALLKDLRSAFIDSDQLEEEDRLFLFATGPEGEETYNVDDEEVFVLKDFEPAMEEPHTFYIRTVSDTGTTEDDVLKELCVCGRVAEYECARCEGRGYCSEDCQEEDYKKHKKLCRKLKQQRKEDRRKQTTLMEPPDLCVCGKMAEFECSSCGVRGYCSAKCQVDHWPVHQKVCVFTTAKY
jgi:hypothetical protein